MFQKNKLSKFIALVFCIELVIFLWAAWTATLDRANFFSIESKFIFAKCARNSGRVSSAIMLITLLMIGFYGLKKIYLDEIKKADFRLLITLFTFNHLIHFIFLYQNFKNISKPLDIYENLRGVITFIFIVLFPILIWKVEKLNGFLQAVIILHLFNACYFINKTFLCKINPPEHPAYHNQFGIVVITLACLYVVYGVFRDYKNCN